MTKFIFNIIFFIGVVIVCISIYNLIPYMNRPLNKLEQEIGIKQFNIAIIGIVIMFIGSFKKIK